jgi:adenosylcobinamide-GDP ribazoletransferase
VSIRSLRAAMSFLTVLPVANADGSAGERLGRAYFPGIGALVGLAAGVAFVVTAAGTTQLLGAAVAVAVLCALTGAIHLDGLADTADGLLTHGDAERRLAVMHEPALGAYGVTAIVAVLLLEVGALASIPTGRVLVALVVAGAISRLATLPVIAFVPYVRSGGKGLAAWDPRRRALDLAVGVGTVAVVSLLDPRHALIAVPIAALIAAMLAIVSRRRLEGATGDVCGAVAELSEVAVLIVFAVR